MEILYKKLDEIKPYENNPRKNDEAVKYVAKSIKEFGFKVPIIIDKKGTIVTGHTRYKAAKELEMDEVPVIMADDLSEEQIKAFRLADNKVAEASSWNKDLLDEELESILNINMEDFGFDLEQEIEEGNPYTSKINIPQYEITGDEPDIDDLVSTDKVTYLWEKIEKSNVTDEQKAFLKRAAMRHLQFDYRNIAEYYAHQDKEMQELMEDSALVIIDLDNAIANGYVELSSTLEEMLRDEE